MVYGKGEPGKSFNVNVEDEFVSLSSFMTRNSQVSLSRCIIRMSEVIVFS